MVNKSISKIVKMLIENDPSLQDALQRGYANYSAIARLLKPTIENMLKEEITIGGLITAVKRAKPAYTPKLESHAVIAKSTINLRTDVAKISLEKTRRNLEKARLSSADFPDSFFQVLEGSSAITIVLDQRIFRKILSKFTSQKLLDTKENLAAIIVQSPENIVNTPGCIVSFYNPISRNRINIEETISCYTDTIIFIAMKDAPKSFTILTDLIENSRKTIDEH